MHHWLAHFGLWGVGGWILGSLLLRPTHCRYVGPHGLPCNVTEFSKCHCVSEDVFGMAITTPNWEFWAIAVGLAVGAVAHLVHLIGERKA